MASVQRQIGRISKAVFVELVVDELATRFETPAQLVRAGGVTTGVPYDVGRVPDNRMGGFMLHGAEMVVHRIRL